MLGPAHGTSQEERLLTVLYSSLQVLEKTYVLQPEDDIVPKEFIGCKINWKEGKDVTFEQVRVEKGART